MNVIHFETQKAFRKWLEKHHAKESEVWVGFYKKDSGKKGMTYKEAVDEALCWGWIDGVRKGIDEVSYVNRFTPRKVKSYWSDVNTKRFHELQELGLVAPAGLAVFETRDTSQPKRYSFENEVVEFDAATEKRFRTNKKAWAYFQEVPPGYRKTMIWWVISAKKEDARERRLQKLIDASAEGRRLQ